MSHNLNTIGEFVSKRDIILCDMRGLDSTYNSFLSSMSLQSSPMKFDEVPNLLLS